MYLGLTSDPNASENKVMMKSDDGGNTFGQLNLTSALPVGYEVVDIAVDPDDGQIIFAIGNESFSNALVGASFDGGVSWENRTSNLPVNKPYNAVAIANGKVYVAGGQLFGSQYVGIYESSDYGLTWQNISTGFPNKVSNDIFIDPSDPQRLFVATEGDGIYISSDGGTTWNYNATGAGENGAARKIKMSPDNNQDFYAGFLSLAVCKTIDGGQTWAYANHGIATLLLNDIEVDPNEPDIILAGFEAENSGGCYISTDSGSNWQLAGGLPATRFSAVTIGVNSNMFAWSNGPTTVGAEGLYKSTDGGQTWANTGPNIGSVFETQIFTVCISDNNPEILFIGGNNFGANGWDAMIYKTDNAGALWTNVYMGTANNSIRHIHIVPGSNDKTVLAAYKSENDKGGLIKSYDGGINWFDINNGLPGDVKWVGSIVSDPADTSVYFAGVGGYGNVSGTVYKSLDGGASWSPTPLNLQNYSKINDILINPEHPEVIYIASVQDGIYMTKNGGENWEPANEGMPATYITSFSNPFYKNDSLHMLAGTYTNSALSAKIYSPEVTGIAETMFNPDITGYPNPVSSILTIEIYSNKNEKVILELKTSLSNNILTNEYITQKCVLTKSEINLNDYNLKSGIYFLVLRTNKETTVRKFLYME
ncbi:MAG: T9SS type A sorting domain-containing protein [Bacteroidales bacterium]|nr:T9SS type A sorting domain-containing protein [Bacteroidales bacterium]